MEKSEATNNTWLKINIKQVVNIIKDVFPRNKTEIVLFVVLLLFYYSYSLFFLFNTSIIDHKELIYDIFFSYDNIFLFHKGYADLHAHPFLKIYSRFIIIIGDIIIWLFGYKAKGIFFIFLSSSAISLGVIYVYRYLKQIIGLSKVPLFTTIFFYSVFSTNMALAFTIETFTVSLMLLTLCCYFYSSHIYKKKEISYLPKVLFLFMLGGITITNAIKSLIPLLFLHKTIKGSIKDALLVLSPFILCLLIVELRFGLIDSLIYNIDLFTSSKLFPGETYEKIIDLFWGSPMLFPKLYNHILPHQGINSTLIGFYSSFWQYIIVGFVFFLVALSVIKNYKNKIVQMLVLLFAGDFFIHVICNYGLGEAFIYGGHWVFIIPLLIGWLYKSISKANEKYLIFGITIVGIVLLINNVIRLTELYHLTKEFFPPVLD